MQNSIYETNLKSLSLIKKGKVRDIYDLGNEMLIVATDRISCFDVVLPTPIPEKGKILTQISNFWMNMTSNIIANHLSDKKLEDIIHDTTELSILKNRTTIAKKAKPLPIEAIVRGYISGSAWAEYKKTGTVCLKKISESLTESTKFPEPIFTPSTKAELGDHDENISYEKMTNIIGKELSEKIKDTSLSLYKQASEYAIDRGIIIADTKFEFGLLDNKLILIDEIFTPDSSRFWDKKLYSPGKSQYSFDKQFVRDYLLDLKWNKTPPAPNLPDNIVLKTKEKYKQAFKQLTS